MQNGTVKPDYLTLVVTKQIFEIIVDSRHRGTNTKQSMWLGLSN